MTVEAFSQVKSKETPIQSGTVLPPPIKTGEPVEGGNSHAPVAAAGLGISPIRPIPRIHPMPTYAHPGQNPPSYQAPKPPVSVPRPAPVAPATPPISHGPNGWHVRVGELPQGTHRAGRWVIEVVKQPTTWDKICGAASRLGKAVGSSCGTVLEEVKAGLGTIGRAVGGARFLRAAGRALGPVAAAVDGVYQLCSDPTPRGATKAGCSVAAGLAGAWAGAKVGAAAGAALGSVIPGAGTAVGAAVGGFVGAVGGYVAGSKLGKLAGEAIYDNGKAAVQAVSKAAGAATDAVKSGCKKLGGWIKSWF